MSLIRWLHLSDFHVGKDDYGQLRLFKYLLDHIRARVGEGLGPDLVFITGDIANKGLEAQYKEFYDSFFWPLLDCLPPETHERIFIVPGNHDVGRMQARAVQTYDVLLRVPEFLDPTDEGRFERSTVLPRFRAYVDNDPTTSDEHWIVSVGGTLHRTIDFDGKKLGVLGLNTAWLSCGDQDRHQLSVGKGLLEDGLERLKDCDIKIVLGHHPLDWLLDTELAPVRALLGRHNAVYLHGHMHKGCSRFEEGAGYPFLAIQSGACFQAREAEVWVNGFLWCELNLETNELQVEPLQWARDQQCWTLDGSAFPERFRQGDRWVLPLPAPAPVKPAPPVLIRHDAKSLQLPAGWIQVDAEHLAKQTNALSYEQALSYFDGRPPQWQESLSSQIPRREIVRKLVNKLNEARSQAGVHVTLLTGAAGEGKSTALLQIISDLVASDADWRILWHEDSNTPLPAEFLMQLPSTGAWLIASDDAELIARRVYDVTQVLYGAARQNIQFLLCCRDTDWKAENADRLPWDDYATFVREPLHGLTHKDAEDVVTAWAAFGQKGLKTLSNVSREEAVRQLEKAAEPERKSSHEGTFFGAVLQVRWGEGLKEHIRNLLVNLGKRPISGGKTLRHAFAYIAALHAEHKPILSKAVLAGVLGCSESKLKRMVLGPLGEEAAIATTGKLIFTRHHEIARAAMEILSEEFYLGKEEIFIDLMRTARKIFIEGTFVPNIAEWNYLSSYFFDKDEQELGISLAKTVLEVEPDNSYFIVKLAQLYRKAEQPEKSVEVFRSVRYQVTSNQRPFYFEWGTAEGTEGYFANSVWLDGLSLSDQAARQPPDNERAKLSLNGLAIAFEELYNLYNARVFIEACGAVAQLGLTFREDPLRFSFQRRWDKATAAGLTAVQPHAALERILEGIATAWEQRDSDLSDWIPSGNTLSFHGLARLLNIQEE
ncbi:MAG: hypothetical protein QOG00_1043 [Pyrinomonadaceae bacterium]|nr:hypothetical protein [Pyrinomonadaceae bacterium]